MLWPLLIGAVACACIVPVAGELMDLGDRVFDALAGRRPTVRKAAQALVLFGLPALAGGAVGGLGAWLWPGG